MKPEFVKKPEITLVGLVGRAPDRSDGTAQRWCRR